MKLAAFISQRQVIAVTGFFILLCIGSLLWLFCPFPKSSTWRSITPGQTTEDELLTQLGQPDSQLLRGTYQVYRYADRKELGGWHVVEIWINSQIVFAIFLDEPFQNEDFQYVSDTPSLEVLVRKYGRPDYVVWTLISDTRYLVWGRDGIAAMVDSDINHRNWENLRVHEMLVFVPQNTWYFMLLQSSWPWPRTGGGITSHNLAPIGSSDHPDVLPQDPYDWTHMPRSDE
jgi:hypothetical protein